MKLVGIGNLSIVDQEGGHAYAGILIDDYPLDDIILGIVGDKVDPSKEVKDLGHAIIIIEIPDQ